MCTGWQAGTNIQRLLPTHASMLAVLVAGPTATQNSPFLPQRWQKPPPVYSLHLHTEGWSVLIYQSTRLKLEIIASTETISVKLTKTAAYAG